MGRHGYGVDRSDGHVVVGEVLHRFCRSHLGQDFVDRLVHHRPVLAPFGSGGETGVLQPFRSPQGIADPVPLVLVTGGDQDVTVLALVYAAGRGAATLAPLGFDPSASVSGDGNLGVAVTGISQADVDGLAHAGPIPLPQCRQNADGGVQGGGAVDEGDPGLHRRPALFPDGHGDAGDAFADGAVADLFGIGAELPVGGGVDHDDAGVEFLEHVVPEPHGLDGAGAEILEENVGDFDQLRQDLFPRVRPEVHAEAFLPRVVGCPVSALTADPWPVITGLLAANPFDLDYLRPHASQNLGTAGAGLVAAEVQHPDPIQGWPVVRHINPPFHIRAIS